MMCINCAPNAVGYYVGSGLEAIGDGLAKAAPSIIYGSQLTGIVTATTTVVGALGQFAGVTDHQRTEKNLLGAFFSVLAMFVGWGMEETAGKTHALGACLKDTNRSLFTGC